MSSDLTIKDLPASEQPRERLAVHGPEALTDAELLAVIIRSGGQQRTAVELARDILATTDIDTLTDASCTELEQFDGIGPVKAGQLLAVFELADRLQHAASRQPQGAITDVADAVEHLRGLRRVDEERVALICLDADNTVLATDLELLTGSVDAVALNVRAVVREAVRHRAAGVILGHNHPSGNPAPSRNDIDATDRLAAALDTVDIELLDHVIVGEEGYCSLYEDGYL